MKRTLSSGYEMPLFAFGTFKILGDDVNTAITHAINTGYRHFDCASFYLNEDEIGIAFENNINSGIVTRDELFIATKAWPTQYRDIRSACLNSINRLKSGHLDLYLLH